MATWHQREARFALRYQTHLTVVRLVGSRSSRVDGRGAGVSACLNCVISLYPHTRCSRVFQSCIFHPREFGPALFSSSLPFPPLLFGRTFSSSALSISAFSVAPARGVVGRGRGGGDGVPPLFSTGGTRPPLPHFFRLKFVQKLVHCCNWLLTETQCKIISVQQN